MPARESVKGGCAMGDPRPMQGAKAMKQASHLCVHMQTLSKSEVRGRHERVTISRPSSSAAKAIVTGRRRFQQWPALCSRPFADRPSARARQVIADSDLVPFDVHVTQCQPARAVIQQVVRTTPANPAANFQSCRCADPSPDLRHEVQHRRHGSPTCSCPRQYQSTSPSTPCGLGC